jgi:hypothetical protein
LKFKNGRSCKADKRRPIQTWFVDARKNKEFTRADEFAGFFSARADTQKLRGKFTGGGKFARLIFALNGIDDWFKNAGSLVRNSAAETIRAGKT